MSGLSKMQLTMIAEVLKKQKNHIKLTTNWLKIEAILDVELSRWANGSLTVPLNSQRRQLIRQAVIDQVGPDLLEVEFSGDRLQMSKVTANEKWAAIKPEQHYVLVRAVGIELLTQVPNCSVRMTITQALTMIQNLAIAQLVVVENLDVFDHWQPDLNDLGSALTLLVFNGSNEQYSAAGVRGLCARSPIPVIAFTDLDPAGLQIAHTLPQVQALLVPEDMDALLQLPHINHSHDFDKQFKQVSYLQTAELGNWQAIADRVLAQRLSIKQQHIISHGLVLVVIRLAV